MAQPRQRESGQVVPSARRAIWQIEKSYSNRKQTLTLFFHRRGGLVFSRGAHISTQMLFAAVDRIARQGGFLK